MRYVKPSCNYDHDMQADLNGDCGRMYDSLAWTGLSQTGQSSGHMGISGWEYPVSRNDCSEWPDRYHIVVTNHASSYDYWVGDDNLCCLSGAAVMGEPRLFIQPGSVQYVGPLSPVDTQSSVVCPIIPPTQATPTPATNCNGMRAQNPFFLSHSL